MTFDYRSLLIRYMEHVGREEGTDFVSHLYVGMELFTNEEIEELERLSAGRKA